MADQHLDLDKILPARRTIMLSGKLLDVTYIPVKVQYSIAARADAFKAQPGDAGNVEFLLDQVVSICQRTDKEVTRDWLLEHCNAEQLTELFAFTLAPFRVAPGAERKDGGSKNA